MFAVERDVVLVVAAGLSLIGAVAHSILGERMFAQLRSEGPWPQARGATVRFAWHIMSVMWIALGAVLAVYGLGDAPQNDLVLVVIGVAFAASALIAAIGSNGRHPAWVVFVVVAASTLLGV